MSKTIIWAAAAVAVATLFATPSFALNGREAIDLCEKNSAKGCKIIPGIPHFGVVIGAPGGEFVACPTLEDECVVLGKTTKPKRSAKDYVVPESLTSGSSGGGDTGVPGTGSGGGGGKQLGSSYPGRGPTTPGVIQ